jgi:energy-coupling factor transporter ATP-binding protein EcfA2
MPVTPDPLRDLYKSLSGKGALPLDPDDPYYVPILQGTPEKDPILMLWQRLDWSESESVNLLTGFRGNGKSTELRRLRQLLEEKSGAKVFLVNMADFLLMTKPLELSDFVLSLMTALGQAVEQDTGLKALTHSYWERLQRFLTSEVQLERFELDLKEVGAPAKLGLKLKNEPDFKQRVQEHLRGHLSRLIEDAQAYVVGLVDAIRDQTGDPNLKVVLLVDSVEQIRGVGTEAGKVHDSVVNLFSGQAASLAFPKLHLVYTIPPYLLALSQNLGRTLGGHPIVSWPNVHVRGRDGNPDPAGLGIMERIIDKRRSGWQDIVAPDTLRRLAVCTGGDLRDFFRLVRECVVAISTARLSQPDAALTEEMVTRVEEQLRNELLPIAEDDARWLARIHHTKDASLPTTDALPALARFFDGNLIMNYLNGQPWYDIHPLLVDEIRRFLGDGDPA